MQQPPLSQRIKEIERRLEVQLFRRKARGMDLTDAGRVFLDKARTMLADYERALQSTRRAARGEQGELSSGTFFPFLTPLIASVYRAPVRYIARDRHDARLAGLARKCGRDS